MLHVLPFRLPRPGARSNPIWGPFLPVLAFPALLLPVLLLVASLMPVPLRGQDLPRDGEIASPAPDDAYLDATAAGLHRAAMESWAWIDEAVVRYTSLVRHRMAVAFRMPLKDRTLYRSESASRVFWDRDGDALVQVLAVREQNPAGVEPPDVDAVIDDYFDPAGDRLFFGMGPQEEDDPAEGDFTFLHPLAPGAAHHYRFQAGDTLTLSFPDGRSLRAVELRVLPREVDVHRISGSLWIEPETGALVRAVYRLADQFDVMRDIEGVRNDPDVDNVPGLFKPWTFDLNSILVDYGLWDFQVWLPRSMRMEGLARAGILRVPVTFDVSYRMESVVTEADLEQEEQGAAPEGVVEERRFESREEAMAFMASLMGEDEDVRYEPGEGTRQRNGRQIRYLVPEDSTWLHRSPHLPPPIWEDAAGFPTDRDVDWVEDVLADLPRPAQARTFWAANWGLQRPDLVRYNRIEGPAVGARVQLRTGSPFGPVSLNLTPFLGLADLEPKGRLAAEWDGVKRQVTLSGYRDLRSAVRHGDHLGPGNSATALLFGRDDGEYYMATGADVTLTPAEAKRRSWSVRGWLERHRAVETETDFNLAHAFDDGWNHRPNLQATELDEVGAEVVVSPWWGTDPLAPQAGLELYLQGGAISGDAASDGGTDEDGAYGRGSVLVRGAVPFRFGGDRLWKVAAEVEAGEAWGPVPLQRNWFLGSTATLRGYPASVQVGEAFGRARLEVARVLPVVSIAAFSDAGWAGPSLSAFVADEALLSVGLGVSVLDGVLRLDVSRGLREPERTRWDFYLDAPF